MKSTDFCNITNRSSGVVAYYLPDERRTREFYPRETKRVQYSEIEEVSNQPGGRELLYNYFYIEEDEVVEEALNIKPEVEYYITEDKIDEWMKSSSLNEFKDALDFAPEGVKDLIKEHAVTLPLNDLSKCEAIKEQLGFDALRAIQNEKETIADDDIEEVAATRRRVEPAKTTTPERRILPKYNVVKRED